MSSFFALVTPVNSFDGSPALPGQLPVFPVHPWFPGHLPGGRPDNSLPGSGGHPWLPGYAGGPGIDNSLPGGGGHPWLPGYPGGGRPDNALPPAPTTPAPKGFFWAFAPAHGTWVKVPDAYAPPPNTKPEAPLVPGTPLPPTPEPK
jgi:hypothetical protein